MFTSLKNKIKEETGNDIPAILTTTQTGTAAIIRSNRYSRNESTSSDLSLTELKDTEINLLKIQLNDLTNKYNDIVKKLDNCDEQKKQYEKDIILLEESVKLSQTQKDIIYDEQDKIQNLQSQELSKLKSLLVFREQEALDRLTILKQTQQQVDNLKNELLRVKKFEPMLEEVQDELEHMRHESQLEKNNLITNLAIVKEENRHLLSRLGILDDSRINFSANLPIDEKIETLVKERKLLEQRLEEAHLHLSDVKSTWSGQNLALETQVSRLSRQVSEETNEKRKALKLLNETKEKLKKYEIDFEVLENEILQRNNKIKILEDEIDDLSTALKETRLENEEEITFLREKVEENKKRKTELKSKISVTDMKLNDIMENAEKNIQSLKQEIFNLEEQNRELNSELEKENHEKRTILLKNAEISQSEELIKQELRRTRDEINEFTEKVNILLEEVAEKELRIKDLCNEIDEIKNITILYRDKLADFDTLSNEVSEKNKLIKTLNQRLLDMKKTLQNELKTNTKVTTTTSQQQHHQQQQQHHQQNQNQNNKNHHFNNYETKMMTTAGITTTIPPTTTIYKICQDHESGESKFVDYSNNGAGIVMDEVNFKYLKHVIVKFLTSREVEARHLIRAVATLLHLTTDEEKLLHDTLNWKMSWFGSKPDHGTGQKSISIPPGL